jgi:hypothetical protein
MFPRTKVKAVNHVNCKVKAAMHATFKIWGNFDSLSWHEFFWKSVQISCRWWVTNYL